MTDLGQPGNPEATPPPEVVPGREALEGQPSFEPAPKPEEVAELRWGRETKEVPISAVNSWADALGVTPEHVKTWTQMGRDAANVYAESRAREAELSRREAAYEAKSRDLATKLEKLERANGVQPTSTRPDILADPVGFWNNVASKIDKLDKVDEIDEIKRMVNETHRRMEEEREAITDELSEQEFVNEYKVMMEQYKAKNLPSVELQVIAQALDKFVTEIPEGTSVRDLLDIGYRIVTWDRVGNARVNQEQRRIREQPRARVEVPSGVDTPASVDGAPPGETLEQRRARLHRQIGGMTMGEWHTTMDGNRG